MRRRTVHMILTASGGALCGAVLVFFALMALGSRYAAEDVLPLSSAEPENASPTYAPPPSSAAPVSPVASVAPSPAATTASVTNIDAGYTFSLPEGYRVAEEITRLERTQVPATATLTITRGSAVDETAYVELIRQLRNDQTATEAPTFLPGNTVTLYRVTGENAEASDAQLARGKRELTTATGLSATRYERVEGLFTYDVTYVRLPSGSTIAVQMMYASEAPFFDAAGYEQVLHSLRPT